MSYTPTTNFGLKKPNYGDPADIKDLNDNTDDIDTIMHQNRRMLAEPFDQTKDYAKGKMVVYEGASYKFITDHSAGNWDASEVDPMPIADGVSGGSVVTKTAEGNPITFSDGADAPLVKCTTEIQGSQDLHGYDKPWVGGAGKNLISSDRTLIIAGNVSGTWTGDTYVRNGVTFEVEYNNTGYPIKITANGTNTTTGSFVFVTAHYTFTADTEYIINGLNNGSMETGRINVQGVANYVDGDNLITGDGETHRIGLQIAGSATVNNVVWYPMLRYATVTDPTFAPYENICPITAYTEGEIEVSDGDGNTTTHTTTYPSAIYRGSEDVVNGEVECDSLILVLDGVTTGAKFTNKGTSTSVDDYYLPVPDAKIYGKQAENITNEEAATYGLICSHLVYNAPAPADVINYRIYIGSGRVLQPRISFPLSMGVDTVEKANQWLASQTNPVQITYELATPTTSSVTPTNLPIRSLSGYNHIESSTGDMEVEYITQDYEPLVELAEAGWGGSSYAETVLYNNDSPTYFTPATPLNAELSDDYTNYNMLVMEVAENSFPSYRSQIMLLTSMINTSSSIYNGAITTIYNQWSLPAFTVTDSTHFQFKGADSSTPMLLYKIVGIKF